MSDEQNKNVDEAWKEAVGKEKAANAEQGSFVPPEADFSFFVTTLALQTSVSLGALANPATKMTEENLPQAKFLIDTLGMLKDKTKGNLNDEEAHLLDNVLYELRMQYIAKIDGGKT